MTSPDSNTPASPQPRYVSRVARARSADAKGHLYREVSPLAVLSLVAGVLSILTAMTWLAVFLPFAGLALGIFALRQIDFAPGVLTGRGLAIAGIVCSVVFGALGCGFKVFIDAAEVPIGYTTLTFPELKPDLKAGELLPKTALEQEGENIYIKGYMYPGKRSVGIQQFVLVPTQKHCQYCQMDLKSTDMIKVELTGNLTIDYTVQPVGVGGRLRVDRSEARKPLGGWPYKIEADYLFR